MKKLFIMLFIAFTLLGMTGCDEPNSTPPLSIWSNIKMSHFIISTSSR